MTLTCHAYTSTTAIFSSHYRNLYVEILCGDIVSRCKHIYTNVTYVYLCIFIFSDTLHIDKQNADAIYIRGMCLYFQDDIDRAFTHFQQVLRLAPDHAKALEIYKVNSKKEESKINFLCIFSTWRIQMF